MPNPGAEKCTKFRINKHKGPASKFCMKTCSLDKVLHRDGPLAPRVGS